MNAQRSDASACELNGKIYITGGSVLLNLKLHNLLQKLILDLSYFPQDSTDPNVCRRPRFTTPQPTSGACYPQCEIVDPEFPVFLTIMLSTFSVVLMVWHECAQLRSMTLNGMSGRLFLICTTNEATLPLKWLMTWFFALEDLMVSFEIFYVYAFLKTTVALRFRCNNDLPRGMLWWPDFWMVWSHWHERLSLSTLCLCRRRNVQHNGIHSSTPGTFDGREASAPLQYHHSPKWTHLNHPIQ